MDRIIVKSGQQPLESDLLNANKFAMSGVAFASEAAFGAVTSASGLAISQTTVASMTVNIGRGSIYYAETTDATAYGILGTDANACVKQGILYAPTTLTATAPGTSGYSQNYLVCASYSDVDGSAVVRNYYNSTAAVVSGGVVVFPAPLSGPGGLGGTDNTIRFGTCNIALIAGVAATTGTQTDPAIPGGSIALYRIVVVNGQTQITAANWVVHPSALFLTPIPLLPVVHNGVDTTSTNTYVATVSPSISALADGMTFDLKTTNANTSTTCTFNPSGLGAVSISRWDGSALVAGDIAVAPSHARLVYDATANKMLLQNPVGIISPNAASVIGKITYSGSQAIANDGALHTIILTGTLPFATVSSGVATITQAGKYAITAVMRTTVTVSSAQNAYGNPDIMINGVEASVSYAGAYISTGSVLLAGSCSSEDYLNVGDTVELRGQCGTLTQTGTTAVNVTSASLKIMKVS